MRIPKGSVFFLLASWCLGLPAVAQERQTSAGPQTTGGMWQELGPRPQVAGSRTRSGRINSIAIDLADDPTGNTVYVGSAFGGVWKTTNVLSSNPTYVPLMDSQPNLAIGSIALDPSTHPATVYVATGTADRSLDALLHGNGIYKSTDGGQTWTLVTSADNGAHPFQQVGFSKVLVDPTNPKIVLAGAVQQILSQADAPQPFAGIYRSIDAGAIWSLVFGTGFIPSCADLVYEPVHGIYYAAISGQGIFKSSDQGATWVATASPFATATVSKSNFFDASLATRSGVVWVFIVDITGQPSIPTPCTPGATRCDTGMAQSDDGGATWAPVTPPPVCPDPRFCALTGGLKVIGAPPGSTELVFGNVLFWFTPAPNGLATSWTSLPFSFTNAVDYHSLAFLDGQRWLVGSDFGFSFAPAAATTAFTDINGNLGTTLSRAASQMGNGAYLTSSQDNGVAESVTGTTWKTLVGGEDTSDASLTQPNQYFTGGGFADARLDRSDDNGQTVVTVVNANVDFAYYPPFQQLSADPTQIILGTCRVWKGPAAPTSPSAGWAPISPDLTSGGSGTGPCKLDAIRVISALAGAPSSADVIYAVTFDGHVQRTTTGTSANPTWSDLTHAPLPNSPRFPFHAVAVSPADSNTTYVGAGGTGSGHVFVSRDGGTTWTDITGNLPDLSVHAILIDPLAPQDVYVGTAADVFVMTDGGAGGANENWQQYGTGLPNAEVFSLEFSKVGSRQIIAGTYGRGVWAIAPLIVPALTLSASSVAFGSQQLGTTSSAQTVTLTNNGNVPLSINSIAIAGTNSGDFAQSNNCGSSMAAGASCTINVTFKAAATGSRTAAVTITDSAAGSPHTITLSGAGVDFAIAGPPGGVTVTAGQAANFTISLTTTGGPTVNATTFSATGNPAATTVTFNPQSITAGSSTGSTTLTITTTARAAVPRMPSDRQMPPWPFVLIPLVVILTSLALLRQGIRIPRYARYLPLAALVLAVAWVAGCGGGGASSGGGPPAQQGTPAGTSTITVTATSGSVSHTTTVTLTVN